MRQQKQDIGTHPPSWEQMRAWSDQYHQKQREAGLPVELVILDLARIAASADRHPADAMCALFALWEHLTEGLLCRCRLAAAGWPVSSAVGMLAGRLAEIEKEIIEGEQAADDDDLLLTERWVNDNGAN